MAPRTRACTPAVVRGRRRKAEQFAEAYATVLEFADEQATSPMPAQLWPFMRESRRPTSSAAPALADTIMAMIIAAPLTCSPPSMPDSPAI